MTQGGPLQSTVSVLYFMYEEGFKWWNLGCASAVAFLLFAADASRVTRGAAALARGSGAPHEARAPRAHRSSTALLVAARRSRCSRCCGWCRCRSCRPGEASTFPPPLLPARSDARATIASCSRAPAWAATSLNSLLVAIGGDAAVARCSTSLAGYAFAKLRFAGRDRIFQLLLGALVIPAQVAMMPLFLLLKQLGLVNTLRRRRSCRRWRASSASSSCASTRCRSPTSCSRPRASTARASCASSARSCVPLLQPILVTLAIFTFLGTLERLHVAADRADRPASCTRCRSRWRACRASTCRTTS